MQNSRVSNADLTRLPNRVQGSMNATKHEIAQAQYIRRSAINVQNLNAAAGPGALFVSALS
jgi:hypothetical protein